MKSMSWVVLAVLVAETLFSESIRSQQDVFIELIGLCHDRSVVMTTLIRIWTTCMCFPAYGGAVQ